MKICGLKLADIGLKFKNTFKYVVCGFGLGFFTFAISYGLEVVLLSSTWATASGCWVPESTMESVREFFFKHYYLIEAVMKFEEIFLDVDGTIWNTTEIVIIPREKHHQIQIWATAIHAWSTTNI